MTDLRSERLSKLADTIEKHPETFSMEEWLLHTDPGEDNWSRAHRLDDFLDAPLRDKSCGTTACIAGWAVHLWGKELESMDLSGSNFNACDAGKRLLHLTEDEADSLFYSTEMSHEEAVFVLREMAAGSTLERAYDRMYDEFRA